MAETFVGVNVAIFAASMLCAFGSIGLIALGGDATPSQAVGSMAQGGDATPSQAWGSYGLAWSSIILFLWYLFNKKATINIGVVPVSVSTRCSVQQPPVQPTSTNNFTDSPHCSARTGRRRKWRAQPDGQLSVLGNSPRSDATPCRRLS